VNEVAITVLHNRIMQ